MSLHLKAFAYASILLICGLVASCQQPEPCKEEICVVGVYQMVGGKWVEQK